MKKAFFTLLMLAPLLCAAQMPSVVGKWKAIDDVTGKVVSVIEIYERGGKIYGDVVEITKVADRKKVCTLCHGEDKNKPIIGLTVIKGLSKDGDEYNGGYILDPRQGKLYKCYLTAEGPDKLKLRGFIGFSFIGRTQYWYRVK